MSSADANALTTMQYGQMSLNIWWSNRPAERFWMEVTDRDEEQLGADLLAPQADGAGKGQWSYTLVAETKPGDVVLHWHRTLAGRPALVGWSEVTGPLSSGSMTWQARGTRGRARGVPTTGASYQMGLGGFNGLDNPVTLDDLNQQILTVKRVYDELSSHVSGTLYFPFIFYRPTELRAQQGYLAKFPAALVAAIPELQGAVPTSPETKGTATASKVKRAVGMPRTRDPEQARAVERWAVDRAKEHYYAQGATGIIELGKPYDLVVHGLGPERHVEVKGSSVQVEAVELTVNEVAHARNFSPTDLVVVDQIQCRRKPGGGYTTSGGVMRVYASWSPADEHLSTTKFRYNLPD